MGYRLYYAEIYAIKLSGGFFNHQREAFRQLLETLSIAPDDDTTSIYEFDRDTFCKAVDKVRHEYLMRRNEPHPVIKMHTYGDVLEILNHIIQLSDINKKFIHLEWRGEGGFPWG